MLGLKIGTHSVVAEVKSPSNRGGGWLVGQWSCVKISSKAIPCSRAISMNLLGSCKHFGCDDVGCIKFGVNDNVWLWQATWVLLRIVTASFFILRTNLSCLYGMHTFTPLSSTFRNLFFNSSLTTCSVMKLYSMTPEAVITKIFTQVRRKSTSLETLSLKIILFYPLSSWCMLAKYRHTQTTHIHTYKHTDTLTHTRARTHTVLHTHTHSS